MRESRKVNARSRLTVGPSQLGSNPSSVDCIHTHILGCLGSIAPISGQCNGLFRELNPGPLAPEARIIPLDQTARCEITSCLRYFWRKSGAKR